MTPRAWMIAAAVAVLAAGGCAMFGVRPSAPVESYPAVFFEGEPDEELRCRLDSAYSVFWKPKSFGVPRTTKWMVSGPHPLLESIAPGARCVWARWSGMRDDYGEGTWVWWNDRLYGLPGLNELLFRAGWIGGDTCDVFLVSKLAVLLYMMGKDDSWGTAPPRAEGELRPLPAEWAWDGPTPKTAFPAIAFTEVEVGVRVDTLGKPPGTEYVFPGVWVDLRLGGGKELQLFVEFKRYLGVLQPRHVGKGSGYFTIEPPKLDPTRQQGRSSGGPESWGVLGTR